MPKISEKIAFHLPTGARIKKESLKNEKTDARGDDELTGFKLSQKS